MNNATDTAKALMDDIPRGVSTRRFSEQTAPQARFLNPEDILQHKDMAYDPKNPGSKIMVGAIGDHLVGIEDDRHIMTVAGSRAGKSVILIGNLLFYRGSVMCTDPKGELANITATKRAALGQKIKVLDPFNITSDKLAQYRASYNPMTGLRLDNPFIVEDALQLTDAMVISSGDEKDPHWNESASHIISGIILYVAIDTQIEEEARHLITVRRLLNNALETTEDKEKFVLEEKIKIACENLKHHGHEDLAAMIMGAIRGFYDKGEDERGSVLSTARRHTQFLDFGSMKSVLTQHDFDLSDLKNDPNGITVYLVLPATRMGLCNRWLRIFINQLLDAMEREPQKPDIPILVALDEFPVLGFMKQLQNAAGQIASFGVKLWIIMQDWGQGKALYKERFESFAANAGILQAFGNVDITTTEYLSKRLGQTIVEETRQTETNRQQIDEGLKGQQLTRQRYPLMTADEIARTFARSDVLKRQLILWAGVSPMILQRVEYFIEGSVLKNLEAD